MFFCARASIQGREERIKKEALESIVQFFFFSSQMILLLDTEGLPYFLIIYAVSFHEKKVKENGNSSC